MDECTLANLRTDSAIVEPSPGRPTDLAVPLTPDITMSTTFSTRFGRKRSVDTGSPVRIEDVEHPLLLPDVKKLYQPASHIVGPAFCRDKNAHSPEVIENGVCNTNTAEANVQENLKLDIYWNSMFQKQQRIYEQMLAGSKAATNIANLLNASLVEKLAEKEIEMNQLQAQFATTNEEFGQLKCIMANTAHDFKSPLNTLILGKTEHAQ